jgi:hypothetical protein
VWVPSTLQVQLLWEGDDRTRPSQLSEVPLSPPPVPRKGAATPLPHSELPPAAGASKLFTLAGLAADALPVLPLGCTTLCGARGCRTTAARRVLVELLMQGSSAAPLRTPSADVVVGTRYVDPYVGGTHA